MSRFNNLEQVTHDDSDAPDLDLTYDKAGNMRTQEVGVEATPTVITYTHDLWNRLVKVEYTPDGGSAATRSEYAYNALNWRIMKRADTNPATDTDLDQQRAMFYSANWQLLFEYIDDDEGFPSGVMDDDEVDADYDRDMRYIWGPRYIDDIVMRQQNGVWNEGKEIFEYANTYYHCTDAQFSTVAVLSDAGALLERVSYDPYGRARHHAPADCAIGEGDVNVSDQNLVIATYGSVPEKGDVNRDGVVNTTDLLAVIGQWGSGLAFGQLSTTDNIIGWDGYVFNAEIDGDGLYTVRYRHYRPGLGRWMERDPAGYVDGMSLLEYARSGAANRTDFSGLKSETWVECDPVQQHGLGGYGITHCRIVTCCDETAECFQIEILGENPDGTVKKPPERSLPYPYSGPRQGRKYQTESYGTKCSISDNEEEPCAIFKCLRRMHRNVSPPPYRPIVGPNSNTYVRRTLERCDLQVKEYQRTRPDQTWGGREYTKKWYTRKPIRAHGWGSDQHYCRCRPPRPPGLPAGGAQLPTPSDPSRNTYAQ